MLVVTYLKKQGVLMKLCEQVRFARKRFGRYEVVDFLVVLFGYAISGERTLEEFYESLQPFAVPFMALFERDRLPSRSALSRFLAALTPAPVEALRTLFLSDLLARPLTPDKQTGGLVDRAGNSAAAMGQQCASQQDHQFPPGWSGKQWPKGGQDLFNGMRKGHEYSPELGHESRPGETDVNVFRPDDSCDPV